MREQVEERDPFAHAAPKLGNDFTDARRERKSPELDRAKHEHVRECLGQVEQGEHRVLRERQRLLLGAEADRRVEPETTVARDGDDGAEVTLGRDVRFDRGSDVLQTVGIEAGGGVEHAFHLATVAEQSYFPSINGQLARWLMSWICGIP